ncbi:MAG: germination protein YpeB [Symbiobacterium thermophilum]|uniref:Germination protein YpeB n=2 Tax=Symbiobacterium thermophilum TaxID=2734 RepID=A0A953IAL7_SYMTR|nr:germination protein YpeB [Symbiobacterium thermophilum]
MDMRRVVTWLSVSLFAAVAVAVWAAWTANLNEHNRLLANALEAERQRNFVDMVHHVEQIQALLGKGLATGSERQNMRYMADVHRHASAAMTAFSSLPLPTEVSSTTGKFLQQVGDFAYALLRDEAAGRSLTEAERAELQRLREAAAALKEQLGTMLTQYQRGGFRWHQPAQLSLRTLMRPPGRVLSDPAASGGPAAAALLDGGWAQLATSMEQMPTFIYNGPFSDHVNQTPPALSGPQLSREEAGGRLATALPDAAAYRVVDVVESGGNLPAYTFRLAPAGTRGSAYTATVSLTRQGGHLLEFLSGRVLGQPALDLEQARAVGQEYLARIGYADMVPTFAQIQDGVAFVAYAYRQGEVIVYPDQAKVKVALDNGEVLGVDARQYLTNHRRRTLPRPRLTPDEARSRLNPHLEVSRVQLALIPDAAGTGEVLTYEFQGKIGDEVYLVYINAETGAEEQILQLIVTDGGTFTL